MLAVGAVHLQRYEYRYSAIPTIGTLFLLSFAGATALGLGLLAPVECLGGRLGGLAVGLLALGGIGLAGLAADLDRPARPSTGYVLPKRLCRGQRQLARGEDGWQPQGTLDQRLSTPLAAALRLRRAGAGNQAG